MSALIEDIKARKVINSRGDETIEIDVITVDGFGSASAPSGASTGKAEVVPFPKSGVDHAIKMVDELIIPEIVGMYADEQMEIDALLHEIDGTENFQRIGGNTAYALSLATAEAASSSFSIPLFQYLAGAMICSIPFPLGNVLGGGKHAAGRTTDIQEFLVLPIGAPSLMNAIKANTTVHKKLRDMLREKDMEFTGGKGDEGAWAPNISNNEALEVVFKACQETSNEIGFECRLGIDVAASSLWNPREERYVYSRGNFKKTSDEQIDYILDIIEEFDLIYVEDSLHEEDFKGFKEITEKSSNCLICGDDIFATNLERLKRGIEIGAGNSLIIKMNQVGTLTDTWKTSKLARESGYVQIVSHRSGETETSQLAHIALALSAPIIKTGVVGGERIAKLNELIRIEESLEISEMAKFTL